MRFALIGLCVFIIASLFFMGEIAWIILLCSLILRVALSPGSPIVRCMVFAVGSAILAAHFAGYKFYGSPVVYDNRPVLHSPHQLSSFVSPNVIVTTDGTRFEVQNVTFTPALFALPLENLQRLINRAHGPVIIEPDYSSPSGLLLQRRCDYWCGNTFFPTFAPRRLPAYAKTDWGDYLVSHGFATTDIGE